MYIFKTAHRGYLPLNDNHISSWFSYIPMGAQPLTYGRPSTPCLHSQELSTLPSCIEHLWVWYCIEIYHIAARDGSYSIPLVCMTVRLYITTELTETFMSQLAQRTSTLDGEGLHKANKIMIYNWYILFRYDLVHAVILTKIFIHLNWFSSEFFL